jgi:hypothetical protein
MLQAFAWRNTLNTSGRIGGLKHKKTSKYVTRSSVSDVVMVTDPVELIDISLIDVREM